MRLEGIAGQARCQTKCLLYTGLLAAEMAFGR
jgi:hypothetical protein